MYKHYNIFRDEENYSKWNLLYPALIPFVFLIVLLDPEFPIPGKLISFVLEIALGLIAVLVSLAATWRYFKNSRYISKFMANQNMQEQILLNWIYFSTGVNTIPYMLFQMSISKPIPLYVIASIGIIICMIVCTILMYSVQYTIYTNNISLSEKNNKIVLKSKIKLISISQAVVIFLSCVTWYISQFILTVEYTIVLHNVLLPLTGVFILACLGMLLRLEIPSSELARRQANLVGFSICITSFCFWVTVINLLSKNSAPEHLLIASSFLSATLFMLAYYTVLRSIEAVKLTKKGYVE